MYGWPSFAQASLASLAPESTSRHWSRLISLMTMAHLVRVTRPPGLVTRTRCAMVIKEMSRDQCLEVLSGARLARLACAKDGQPYIVPVYIAYESPDDGEPRLYGFTTPGQKVEWMRANPLVCVEVDDVTAPDHWVSVIITGRYEEL